MAVLPEIIALSRDNIDLGRLGMQRFLVIGRAGMDFYPDPPGSRTEEATQFFAALGGSSANIAVSLCRQGAKASLLSCVSDDAVGRFCRNQLEHYGVDHSCVRAVGGEYRNSLAVSESRIEEHQTVIYRNGAADFQMSLQDLAAEPSREACFKALELAGAAGLPLVFDVDYRPYSWVSAEDAASTYSRAAALCDIIVGNDVEFGFMAGSYDKGLEKARQLARDSASLVVYKMGEHGAITLTPDDQIKTGIFPVEALKPTGAGDSFLGGLIASLASGHTLKEAVLRGSACASIVVSRVGCAPAMPDCAELDDFMSNHTESLNN